MKNGQRLFLLCRITAVLIFLMAGCRKPSFSEKEDGPQVTIKQENTLINPSGEYDFRELPKGKPEENTAAIAGTVNADNKTAAFALMFQPDITNISPGDLTAFAVQSVSPETEGSFSSQAPVTIGSRDDGEPASYEEEAVTEEAMIKEAPADENTAAAKNISLSIGLEGNMNARENFAGAAVIGFDYQFLDILAAGVSLTASTDFKGVTVLEPMVTFRGYYWPPRENSYSGLFAQVDIGAYLVIEERGTIALFDGGLRIGFRLPIGKRFFAEPYGRIGYPYFFGLGVAAGIKL